MTSPGSTVDPAVRTRLSNGSLAGNWTLDGARSSAAFKTKTLWGLVPVKGRFTEVSGDGSISPSGGVTGAIRLASGSVDTKNKKRDTHLRSDEFFNADAHPQIIFTVERIEVDDEGATAAGTLEIAGRQRPLTVPVSVVAGAGDTVELDTEIDIDRSEFGLMWNQLGMASMKNTVTIHAAWTKVPAGG